MFGRDAKQATFPPTNAFYSAYLLSKLAKLSDLVATSATTALQRQKNHYKEYCYLNLFSCETIMAFSVFSRLEVHISRNLRPSQLEEDCLHELGTALCIATIVYKGSVIRNITNI